MAQPRDVADVGWQRNSLASGDPPQQRRFVAQLQVAACSEQLVNAGATCSLQEQKREEGGVGGGNGT